RPQYAPAEGHGAFAARTRRIRPFGEESSNLILRRPEAPSRSMSSEPGICGPSFETRCCASLLRMTMETGANRMPHTFDGYATPSRGVIHGPVVDPRPGAET